MINKILQGDCLELFKTIPDDSFDVSFADPPFNLNKKYNSYKDKLSEQEYIDWCDLWLSEMVRVTKPTGSIFIHNIPKWSIHHASHLNKIADFKNWISWKALSGPPNKKCLQPGHYVILYYAKDGKQNKSYPIRSPHLRCRKCNYLSKDYGGKKYLIHPFGPKLSDVWTDLFRIRHKKKRDIHPCQLPPHLLERIILMSSDEGDIIFDPFLGTGTTAIASKKLGRRYCGFEKDKNYLKIAEDKINKETSSSKLGNSWVSYHLNKVITIRDKDWEDIEKSYNIPIFKNDIEHISIKMEENSF